jgi:membrane-associated phospholipid phosphatase
MKINNVADVIDWVGISAPIILFIFSLFLLRNWNNYLIFYVIGFGLNNLLNIVLKILIKEPRPSNDSKFIDWSILKGNRIGYDKYGMPSGHAQNCAFSLIFITLALNQPWITFIYAILTFICMIQRYKYKNHTIMQLIVGIMTGSLFASVVYFISTKYILGKISNKKDDGHVRK